MTGSGMDVKSQMECSGCQVDVGRRVECDGYRATIKWIGEIPPAQGTWFGVDWDDFNRGKHDGSHNGIKYFETRYSGSGSFVRPSKVNTGMTFEAAVRGRYQDDPTVETEVTEQLQRQINARFVEVVGMHKIGKKQSILEELGTVVLSRWMIWGTDEVDLATLFPKLHTLDISNSLLSSWTSVAKITSQLPSLRFLNISGNMLSLPEHPDNIRESVCHVVHLVLNNMIGYTWQDLLTCFTLFPKLRKLQVAFNQLEVLGSVPNGLLESLEELDIGVNPISVWEEICHLGSLPRLNSLNANNCKLERITFPSTPATERTSLFPSLKCLMIANNPLNTWECTGELNKLPNLEDLVISFDVKTSYIQEFTLARISNLKILNKTEFSPKEKRDCELFYLKFFSNEYYGSGGKEDQDNNSISEDFKLKHPTYLQLVRALGAPLDETTFKTQKSQKLKDLKVELKIVISNEPERKPSPKAFLLTTKLSKVKMMLKRHLKLNPSANVMLAYLCKKDEEVFEIPLDNDMQDLSFYSIGHGDTLIVRW